MYNGFVYSGGSRAAKERRKQLEDEEENMTPYSTEDLSKDWEFKILRSQTNAFKNPEVLEEVLEDEAIAGWEMLEKLDDNRIRFKRPKSARKKDYMLPEDIDPYRTSYGTNVQGWVLGGTLLFVLLMLVFVAIMIITNG